MDGIISSRNYDPGDWIFSEEAFARVLPWKLQDRICEFCCKPSLNLRNCIQCKFVKYCGKNCQVSDWKTHRLECKYLKNLPKNNLDNSADIVRLLGKVILKIQGKDWKSIKKQVLGRDYSFDDIESHYKDFTENERLNLFFKEVKELTGKYIGFENLPVDEDLIKIVGKVKFNTFTTRALCFYIGMAMFSIECIANSDAIFNKNAMKIVAFRKIKEGTDKICLPLRAVLLQDVFLQDTCKGVSTRVLDDCKCTDCSLPYGTSILSKIIDEKRAFSVIQETEALLLAITMFPKILDEPDIRKNVDDLLEKQKGVLGDTNFLRLKLLSFKCFAIGGGPSVIHQLLKELEASMSSVFGNFYSEMYPIYEGLALSYLQLGNPVESLHYALQARRIRELMSS